MHALTATVSAPPATLPDYMTPRQVADMLKVNKRSVLRWAHEDATMPVSRVGRRVVRFERAALLRWLERKRPRGARQGTPRFYSS